MAQSNEAVQQYHHILGSNGFRDLTWAGQLQDRMRKVGLVESGRVLAPVLRPCFLTREQASRLYEACARIAALLDALETLTADNPELQHRLHLLPAERVLIGAQCGYRPSSLASGMRTAISNGSLSISGIETCKPVGLGYANLLADLFLQTPVMGDFQRSGFVVSKLGCGNGLLRSVTRSWKERRTGRAPSIVVAELRKPTGVAGFESDLLSRSLSERGTPARLALPDQFRYANGRLEVAGKPVDVVYRRFAVRDLLVHFDLTHPLLRAYRDGAACVVNGFRSEVARRREFFELITDEVVQSQLPVAERQAVQQYVPWTRSLTRRKTCYKGQAIDLTAFARRNRELFVLHSGETAEAGQSHSGTDCSQNDWDRILASAEKTGGYVLQERPEHASEIFPTFQYGGMDMKQLQVTIHPYVVDGQLQGACAQLDSRNAGVLRTVAIAPVLIVEEGGSPARPVDC